MLFNYIQSYLIIIIFCNVPGCKNSNCKNLFLKNSKTTWTHNKYQQAQNVQIHWICQMYPFESNICQGACSNEIRGGEVSAENWPRALCCSISVLWQWAWLRCSCLAGGRWRFDRVQYLWYNPAIESQWGVTAKTLLIFSKTYQVSVVHLIMQTIR